MVHLWQTNLVIPTYLAAIRGLVTRPWTLMEVCGTHTMAIAKHGIRGLMPDTIKLLSGPGCPVCVTPLEMIEKALDIAARAEVIFTSFGDMLRVPGSDCDLQQVRSRGGQVRVVYSPLDALELAQEHPLEAVGLVHGGREPIMPRDGHGRNMPYQAIVSTPMMAQYQANQWNRCERRSATRKRMAQMPETIAPSLDVWSTQVFIEGLPSVLIQPSRSAVAAGRAGGLIWADNLAAARAGPPMRRA